MKLKLSKTNEIAFDSQGNCETNGLREWFYANVYENDFITCNLKL